MTQDLRSGQAQDIPVIHAGFIPLTDCAPLIVAKELGFDRKHGVSLELHKDVSWANIRDKAEAGLIDCAIMLAPMPLASTLGLGGRRPVDMIATMATSLNGNAITVSHQLYDEMCRVDRDAAECGGMKAARSVARVVERRRADGLEPLTFGMVHPFSSHNYDLRYWLADAGIDPTNDVNLVVVPPPLIAGSLKAGRIDGFCVGEPWNSVAVADGSGVIVATKAELWAASPEKVLGMRRAFADENADTVRRLTAAIFDACQWLDVPANRITAAEILARDDVVGIAPEILSAALGDEFVRGGARSPVALRNTIVFSRDGANFPWASHAIWILTQMIRWGQASAPFDIAAVARTVYRSDIFRAAVGHASATLPDSDCKSEGGGAFFGDREFDPARPIDYLKSLDVRDHSADLARF
jgi:two-component system, oxyanion-binding sensor